MKGDKNERKFIVIQLGSRMHYAVPAFLAKRKSLVSFYTDIHSNHFLLRLIKFIIPVKFQFKLLKNLLARKLPIEINKKLVKDQILSSLIFFNNVNKRTKILFDRVLKDKFLGANSLYTNFINDDIELIRKAKENGLEIIHEVIITPYSGLLMLEENNLYPNVETNYQNLEIVKKGMDLDLIKWKLSDKIIVPSKMVYKNLIELGVDQKKLFLVPYGLDKKWMQYKSTPKKGKILFVGLVGLRKGVHYLAKASRIIASRGYDYEIIVAGKKLVDTNLELFKGPQYVGHIPRNQIIKEYLSADVFVLPTIAEGLALVHLEAMACGVPVITTENCGSVVDNNQDGYIIPIRDPIALADKIINIVEKRGLRDRMSRAAKIKASHHTWCQYEEKLIKALNS